MRAASRPPLRWLRPLILLMGLGLTLFLCAAALFFVRARTVPPDVPPDTSPPAIARAERRFAAVREQVAAVRREAQSGRPPRPYRIEVRADDVNTLLRTNPRIREQLQRHQVTRPRLEVRDGRLRAGGLVTYRGQRVYVTAEGTVTPGPDGRITFRPESIRLGQATAPTALTRRVSEQIARAFERGDLQLPGRVRAVRLENGSIVVEGDTGR